MRNSRFVATTTSSSRISHLAYYYIMMTIALAAVITTNNKLVTACEELTSASSSSSSSPPAAVVEVNEDDVILFRHFSSISSTQDHARRIVTGRDDYDNDKLMICVTATEQTNGRGTSGRVWQSHKGNTFVTIGMKQNSWMGLSPKLPLTLLPLKIGILVARRVKELLDQCVPHHHQQEQQHRRRVTLKWPNDVLVNEEKIAGILIESTDNGWFLIGIGVNLAYAPPVPTSGPNFGRSSTSLSKYCNSPPPPIPPPSTSSSSTSKNQPCWEEAASKLGQNLAKDLYSWLQNPTSAESITREWKEDWVDWNMDLVMRDTPGRELVQMVDMLPDGRIQVVGKNDGKKQTLVSDYFL